MERCAVWVRWRRRQQSSIGEKFPMDTWCGRLRVKERDNVWPETDCTTDGAKNPVRAHKLLHQGICWYVISRKWKVGQKIDVHNVYSIRWCHTSQKRATRIRKDAFWCTHRKRCSVQDPHSKHIESTTPIVFLTFHWSL